MSFSILFETVFLNILLHLEKNLYKYAVYSRGYSAYIRKIYAFRMHFLSQSTTVIPQKDRGLSRKTPRSIEKDIGISLKNGQKPCFFSLDEVSAFLIIILNDNVLYYFYLLRFLFFGLGDEMSGNWGVFSIQKIHKQPQSDTLR